jgi:hypothetical protein
VVITIGIAARHVTTRPSRASKKSRETSAPRATLGQALPPPSRPAGTPGKRISKLRRSMSPASVSDAPGAGPSPNASVARTRSGRPSTLMCGASTRWDSSLRRSFKPAMQGV